MEEYQFYEHLNIKMFNAYWLEKYQTEHLKIERKNSLGALAAENGTKAFFKYKERRYIVGFLTKLLVI